MIALNILLAVVAAVLLLGVIGEKDKDKNKNITIAFFGRGASHYRIEHRHVRRQEDDMKTIKISPNVEFDVIYADGTRHHVSEGVLFEVKDNKLTFHNGTDRAAVLIGVAEAAVEAAGALGLNEAERALLIYKIHKRIFGRKDAAADMKINAGGQNNDI